jgi:hypothetical protein
MALCVRKHRRLCKDPLSAYIWLTCDGCNGIFVLTTFISRCNCACRARWSMQGEPWLQWFAFLSHIYQIPLILMQFVMLFILLFNFILLNLFLSLAQTVWEVVEDRNKDIFRKFEEDLLHVFNEIRMLLSSPRCVEPCLSCLLICEEVFALESPSLLLRYPCWRHLKARLFELFDKVTCLSPSGKR